MKSRFNLSDWALEHRSLVWYFMMVSAVAGVLSYINLGREEDPYFTIKTMVIAAQWPGATVEDTARQVTDRIEKKLEELDTLDYTAARPRRARPSIYRQPAGHDRQGRDVPDVWVRVRNMINDIRAGVSPGRRRARSSTTTSATSSATSTPSPPTG